MLEYGPIFLILCPKYRIWSRPFRPKFIIGATMKFFQTKTFLCEPESLIVRSKNYQNTNTWKSSPDVLLALKDIGGLRGQLIY